MRYDADLRGTDLRRATLFYTDRREADLSNAALSGADLRGADLRGADLRGAVGLVQEQLDGACDTEDTKLPECLTVKLCEWAKRR